MEDTDALMADPPSTEDTLMAEPEPLTPLSEPAPSPSPEPDSAPLEPNGVLPDQPNDNNSVSSDPVITEPAGPTEHPIVPEPVAVQPDVGVSEPTGVQPDAGVTEPAVQADTGVSEPTGVQPDAGVTEPAVQADMGVTEPTGVQTDAGVTEPIGVQTDGGVTEPKVVQANTVDGVKVEPPRRKRKIEEVGFENAVYYKIRSVVKNLRPLFLQVSENPNFRETNIPADILTEITTILNLSKQLRADLTTFNPPLKPSSIKEESKKETPTNGATENQILTEDEKLVKDVPKNLEDGFKGSYVVGGSPIGWNYLVYPGSHPVYYGRTKAEKRACEIAGEKE